MPTVKIIYSPIVKKSLYTAVVVQRVNISRMMEHVYPKISVDALTLPGRMKLLDHMLSLCMGAGNGNNYSSFFNTYSSYVFISSLIQ